MSEADHDASLWMEDDQAEDRCHLLAPHEPHPWGEVDVTTLPNWCVGVLAERAPGFRCARGDHTYHGWGPCPAPAVPVGVQPEPAEEECEWPECGFRCAETSLCAPAVPVVHPEPEAGEAQVESPVVWLPGMLATIWWAVDGGPIGVSHAMRRDDDWVACGDVAVPDEYVVLGLFTITARRKVPGSPAMRRW